MAYLRAMRDNGENESGSKASRYQRSSVVERAWSLKDGEVAEDVAEDGFEMASCDEGIPTAMGCLHRAGGGTYLGRFAALSKAEE